MIFFKVLKNGKSHSPTPFIKAFEAIGSINYSTLNIFLLNLFKYALVDPSPDWVTTKRSIDLLLKGILVLKRETSLEQM